MKNASALQVTTPAVMVHEVRPVGDGAFVLRFDRHGMDFSPGQYVSVGPGNDVHMREYSIYSAADADFLEILVKKIDTGHVSPRLATMQTGAPLAVDGPFGFFTLDEDRQQQRYCFIATGTGISPFHCFTRSFPGLQWTLLHGIRSTAEQYEYPHYDRSRIITCVSRGPGGDYSGRVTTLLRERAVQGRLDPQVHYYLCGNCDMIYEAFDILQSCGIPPGNLFAEVYF